jgi:hypothetical protein
VNALHLGPLSAIAMSVALVVACKASEKAPSDGAPRSENYASCPPRGIQCAFCCEQEAPTDPHAMSRAAQWRCDCERCGDVCASSQRCGGDPNFEGTTECLTCVFQDDKCKDVGRRACDDDPACAAYRGCLASCPSLADAGAD